MNIMMLSVFRFLNLVTSMISIYYTYQWYNAIYYDLVINSGIRYKSAWPLQLKTAFLFSILISGIHVPIYLEGPNTMRDNQISGKMSSKLFYDFNKSQWLDYITILSFLKLYILYSYIKLRSLFNSITG